VVDGFIDEEKYVYIEDATGEIYEVNVPTTAVAGDTCEVWEVARDGNRVLIELPRESSRGNWRIWVDSAQVAAA
jgi:hypothetical protein